MLKRLKGKKKKIRKFTGTAQKLLKQNKIYNTTKQRNIRERQVTFKKLRWSNFQKTIKLKIKRFKTYKL